MSREILWDCETTGLDPKHHRMVSVAAVELVNKAPTGSFMHFYLNPDRESDPRALEVHGLTTDFLSTKPRFGEIAASLVDYISGDPLVIHNAVFDLGFASAELRRMGRSMLLNRAVCTLCEARKKFGPKGNRLDDLTIRFGLENLRDKVGSHGALVDCLQLVNVYRSLVGLVAFPWDTVLLSKYFTQDPSGRSRQRSSQSESLSEVAQPVIAGGSIGACGPGIEQVAVGDDSVHNARPSREPKSSGTVAGAVEQSSSVIDDAFKTLWVN